MDTSIFLDLTKKPTTNDLEIPLHKTFTLWMEIRDFVFEKYPNAFEEWHIAVKKYGWGFRIKDKKRAIIYLSPREGFFGWQWYLDKRQPTKFWPLKFQKILKQN
jgi:hypothetical protein